MVETAVLGAYEGTAEEPGACCVFFRKIASGWIFYGGELHCCCVFQLGSLLTVHLIADIF